MIKLLPGDVLLEPLAEPDLCSVLSRGAVIGEDEVRMVLVEDREAAFGRRDAVVLDHSLESGREQSAKRVKSVSDKTVKEGAETTMMMHVNLVVFSCLSRLVGFTLFC